MGLESTDIVSRTTRIAQRLFEERMLVITAKDSMLHRFNEVGTFIWQLLETPLTVGAVCQVVGNRFEGFEPRNNAVEVHRFLEALETKGCVEIGRETPTPNAGYPHG